MLKYRNLKSEDEIIAERSYNRKVFAISDKQKKYIFHAGHIQYQKEDGSFEEIDTNIESNGTGWKIEKASYKAYFPQYADEKFIFRNRFKSANHEVNMIPKTSHVQGVVVNLDEENYVDYKNAFAPGIDLRVYAHKSGLKEIVVINEKPLVIKDMFFEYVLDFDNSLDFKTKNQTKWNKNSKHIFKGERISIGKEGEQESYFREAFVWDSNGKKIPVDIKLYKDVNDTILRKTVTADFLENAVYPVFTDHATSYFVGSGDGYIKTEHAAGSGSWEAVHDSSDRVNILNYTNDNCASGVSIVTSGFGHHIYRSFFPIDTSGIDDSATITSAEFFLYMYGITNDNNDGNDFITVVQTSQASTSELVNDDFSQCGAIDNPTEGIDTSERKDMGSIFNGAVDSFILNATGIGWINKTGFTKLGIRSGHDALDTPPTYSGSGNNHNIVNFHTSEYTGTSRDPYLEVTVSVAAEDIDINLPTLFPIKGVTIS